MPMEAQLAAEEPMEVDLPVSEPRVAPIDPSEISREHLSSEQCVFYDDFERDFIAYLDTGFFQPRFLLSGAGCGKSYVQHACRNLVVAMCGTTRAAKSLAFLGCAAANIGGGTLHSTGHFSTLSIGQFVERSPEKLALIAEEMDGILAFFIDEFPTCSNLLLAEWDLLLRLVFNKELPFGGKAIIGFGDFYQIPPIKAPSIYEELPPQALSNREKILPNLSPNLWRLFRLSELKENLRTKDPNEAEILRTLRVTKGSAIPSEIKRRLEELCSFHTEEEVDNTRKLLKCTRPEAIQFLEKRYQDPEFLLQVMEKLERENPNKDIALLVPNNTEAAKLNELKIQKSGRVHTLEPESLPRPRKVDKEWREGERGRIRLAIGIRVMITQNISVECGIYNGAMGRLEAIGRREVTIVQSNGKRLNIPIQKFYNKDRTDFWEQFPIMVAEATTIHKIQGATYDGVVVSTAGIFGAGSLYTALSRARELSLCRLTSFNYAKWEVSTRAAAEYQRMRNEPPLSFSQFALTDSQRLRALQNKSIAMEKRVKILGEEADWLKTDYQARAHSRGCEACYRNFDNTNVIPTTLKCGHNMCLNCAHQILALDRHDPKLLKCPFCRKTYVTRPRDLKKAYSLVPNYTAPLSSVPSSLRDLPNLE